MANVNGFIVVIAFLLLSIFAFPRNCFAYLDPGSGSFILQIVIGFILGGFILLKNYWNKFKLFARKLFAKKQNGKDK